MNTIDLFNNISFENDSNQPTTQIEDEIRIFAKVLNFEQFKKALSSAKIEQWQIILPPLQEVEDSPKTRIRVRKIQSKDKRTEYNVTIKTKRKKEGDYESNSFITEGFFKQFALIAPEGQFKQRYTYDAGNNLTWEIDVYPDGNGGYYPWVVCELEHGESLNEIPSLPIDVEETILPDAQETDEGKEKVDNLYQKYFTVKNKYFDTNVSEEDYNLLFNNVTQEGLGSFIGNLLKPDEEKKFDQLVKNKQGLLIKENSIDADFTNYKQTLNDTIKFLKILLTNYKAIDSLANTYSNDKLESLEQADIKQSGFLDKYIEAYKEDKDFDGEKLFNKLYPEGIKPSDKTIKFINSGVSDLFSHLTFDFPLQNKIDITAYPEGLKGKIDNSNLTTYVKSLSDKSIGYKPELSYAILFENFEFKVIKTEDGIFNNESFEIPFNDVLFIKQSIETINKLLDDILDKVNDFTTGEFFGNGGVSLIPRNYLNTNWINAELNNPNPFNTILVNYSIKAENVLNIIYRKIYKLFYTLMNKGEPIEVNIGQEGFFDKIKNLEFKGGMMNPNEIDIKQFNEQMIDQTVSTESLDDSSLLFVTLEDDDSDDVEITAEDVTNDPDKAEEVMDKVEEADDTTDEDTEDTESDSDSEEDESTDEEDSTEDEDTSDEEDASGDDSEADATDVEDDSEATEDDSSDDTEESDESSSDDDSDDFEGSDEDSDTDESEDKVDDILFGTLSDNNEPEDDDSDDEELPIEEDSDIITDNTVDSEEPEATDSDEVIEEDTPADADVPTEDQPSDSMDDSDITEDDDSSELDEVKSADELEPEKEASDSETAEDVKANEEANEDVAEKASDAPVDDSEKESLQDEVDAALESLNLIDRSLDSIKGYWLGNHSNRLQDKEVKSASKALNVGNTFLTHNKVSLEGYSDLNEEALSMMTRHEVVNRLQTMSNKIKVVATGLMTKK